MRIKRNAMPMKMAKMRTSKKFIVIPSQKGYLSRIDSRSQQFNLELLQKKTSKRRIRCSRLSSHHHFY